MANAVGAVARPDDPPHLKIAFARLGLKEVAGPGDNPDVVAMFARVGRTDVRHDETSWCAAFVGSCLVEAGVPLAKLPAKDDRLTARSYLDFGRKVTEPARGDIVVFWRGSPSSWMGHVAFFLRFVTIDGRRYVEVIGGNQANAVTIARFPVGQVLGYRRPEGVLASGPSPNPAPKPGPKPAIASAPAPAASGKPKGDTLAAAVGGSAVIVGTGGAVAVAGGMPWWASLAGIALGVLGAAILIIIYLNRKG